MDGMDPKSETRKEGESLQLPVPLAILVICLGFVLTYHRSVLAYLKERNSESDAVLEKVAESLNRVTEQLVESGKIQEQSLFAEEVRPGTGTRLKVSIKQVEAQHELTVGRLESWVQGGARSPGERVLKNRLRAVLSL